MLKKYLKLMYLPDKYAIKGNNINEWVNIESIKRLLFLYKIDIRKNIKANFVLSSVKNIVNM
jgi:hypothetical protein